MRVLGLERAPVDLAGAEARQRLVEKMMRSGILNFASLPSRKARSSSSASCSPFFSMDDRDRHFAEPLVGRAEHRRFGDRGAGVAFRLDLGRRDILAAADDDVLLAVDDEQIAVLVEIADVAGADDIRRR